MRPTKILKVLGDSPREELDFELKFISSLSLEERYDMLMQRSRDIKELLATNGHYQPVQIIKRS